MANQEHLDLLKQGVQVWNQWRLEHSDVWPDLSKADLSYKSLGYANLSKANLSSAYLNGAHVNDTNLSGTDLSYVRFNYADLIRSDLSGADLRSADMRYANLSEANLSRANLSYADLRHTNISSTNLSKTNLSKVRMEWTIFSNVDLRTVKGLKTVKHGGPSTIGTDTIARSEGNIPEVFLHGAGLTDVFIISARSLVQNPIKYYTCFISYSSKDHNFAERLYADLQIKGVRCWFAPEDLKIGDKLWHRIDESIRLYDKLLLVLSERSIASNWVAYEVERALNKEPEGVPNVLYPIRLDDAVMKSKAGWADDIRRTRHIGDFTHWTNHDDYQKAFNRLLRALKAEAQKMGLRDGTTNGG